MLHSDKTSFCSAWFFKLCLSQKFDETFATSITSVSNCYIGGCQYACDLCHRCINKCSTFSISWKLLYRTRCQIVQNVVAYHTTTCFQLWKPIWLIIEYSASLNSHCNPWYVNSLCQLMHYCDHALILLVLMWCNHHQK
jgi:hypothetical protein